MGSSESLLKIIEDRAKKSIPDTLVYRTPMVITTVVSNFQAKAKIVGHDAEYTLLNKTGRKLVSGDNVVVESTGTNLNNGVIAYTFGKTTVNAVEDTNLATGASVLSFYTCTAAEYAAIAVKNPSTIYFVV